MITLTQYFLGNHSFGVSWPDVADATYYTVQAGSGSPTGHIHRVENLNNFIVTGLTKNTPYQIQVKAYNATNVQLDFGSLNATTVNADDPDTITNSVIFTTKLKDQEVKGDEFGPDKEEKYNSLYVNCGLLGSAFPYIYYNQNPDEVIDDTKLFDPVTDKKNLTSRYTTSSADGSPLQLTLTKKDVEDETGEKFVLPPGAKNPFPIIQKLYFSAAFFYMEDGEKTPDKIKCMPFTPPSLSIYLSALPKAETHLYVITKCKIVSDSFITCPDTFLTTKTKQRYKMAVKK